MNNLTPKHMLVLGLLLLIALTTHRLWTTPKQPIGGTMPLAEALGTDDQSFTRAEAPRDFQFPADHGPHPEFKTEWWYFTGNLTTTTGRHFGYQLTFFRVGLSPSPVPRSSAWATNGFYLAHFALTDVANQKFYRSERSARSAQALSGAQAEPFHVWLGNWNASSESGDLKLFTLKAAQDNASIELQLQPRKPIVLQGERGLSRKSSTPGNASYYYSLTRIPTSGTLQIGTENFAVSGDSWMDREWSTSALGPEQAGWDWFALQLDDGRDLMIYQMRRKDGTADVASSGTLVDADGQYEILNADQFSLQPAGNWTSPATGIRYPVHWRIMIPALGLSLNVEPYQPNQEMDLSVRYWEGAVKVSGSSENRSISGSGYLELAGYERAIR